jgi:hypothetical protein
MFALAAILPIIFIGTLTALGAGAVGLILGGKTRRAAAAPLAVDAIAVSCVLAAWMA